MKKMYKSKLNWRLLYSKHLEKLEEVKLELYKKHYGCKQVTRINLIYVYT